MFKYYKLTIKRKQQQEKLGSFIHEGQETEEQPDSIIFYAHV